MISTQHIISGMRLDTLAAVDSAADNTAAVQIMPQANPALMSQLPIIQSGLDSSQAHTQLEQPRFINFSQIKARRDRSNHRRFSYYRKAFQRMDELLQDEQQRQSYEQDSFDIALIEKRHIRKIPWIRRRKHSTLGIRGVIAKTALPAGSPLIYSAQYLAYDEWLTAISDLSEHLEKTLGLTEEESMKNASMRMATYSWSSTYFNNEEYFTPAYGAGNIAAFINHDYYHPNMVAVHAPLLDQYQQPCASVWMYYTTRKIKAGEQLLVSYGKDYWF